KGLFWGSPGALTISKGEIGAFLPDFEGLDKASVIPRTDQVKADRRRVDLRGRRHRRRKLLEKVVRHLLGSAGDQPLAELGELAADLRLDIAGEQRAAVLVGKLHRSAALGEAGDAALALAGNPVAVGWVEVGELYLALPLGLDGADLRRRDCLEFGVGDLVELLAARDA